MDFGVRRPFFDFFSFFLFFGSQKAKFGYFNNGGHGMSIINVMVCPAEGDLW